MWIKSYKYIYIFLPILFLAVSSCKKSKDGQSAIVRGEKALVTKKINPIKIKFDTQTITNVKPIVTKAEKPQLVFENNFQIKSEGEKIKINTDSVRTFTLKEIPYQITKPIIVIAKPPIVTQALPYRTRENNPNNFKYLDVEQGIKNGAIFSIIEDQNGAIWFGSKLGLTKYDGKHFYHYSEFEGLIFNNIKTLFIDHNNDIWIGTDGGGLSKFNGKTFTNYNTDCGLPSNNINTIFEDRYKNIWVGTEGGGALKIDGTKISYFNEDNEFPGEVKSINEDKNGNILFAFMYNGIYALNKKSVSVLKESTGLIDNSIISILKDNKGNCWFGGDKKGLSKYDGETFTNYTKDNGLPDNTITSITEDLMHNIWIGTFNGGISKYDGLNFYNYSINQGLNSNSTLNICCAKNGIVWIGTNGVGIAKYKGEIFTHKTTNEGLTNNWIWSINQSIKSGYWFTTNGGGINNFHNNQFKNYTSEEGLNQDVIISQLVNKDGSIWLGSYENGACLFENNEFKTITTTEGLSDNAVWTIVKDKKSNVWFGTQNGLSKYDGRNIINYSNFQSIEKTHFISCLIDKNDVIWLGTNDNGLLQFKNNKFYKITKEQGLIDNVISCIAQDSSGNLWFGSQNGGVSRLKDGVFANLYETNGLSNSAVLAMVCDEKGNMWLGTRAGINKLPQDKINLNKSELESTKNLFITYGITEGFTGNNCVRNSVFMDNDHDIWWGTTKMLTKYNPKIDIADTIAPNILINSIKLFSEDVNWNNILKNDTSINKHKGIALTGTTAWNNLPINLTLPYDQNHLTFDFIGINFNSQEKIKYQYILEGLEDEWSPITSNTEADYRTLPHGKFTFKIKAVNKDGIWSEPIAYSFEITPPWWKTWWFRTLAALAIILIIYFYIKYRETVLKVRQQELEQTVDERTKEVVSQKHIVEEKQKEILDSINYAKRIQHSLLASDNLLNTYLSKNKNELHTATDFFIYFKPKDIVSGDFYWASLLSNSHFAIVTADSTGHGVPGAIMSMLNISALNEAINGHKISEPNEIFNFARTKIISQLANDGSREGGKDGMDASITAYDFENLKLHYAAANNPIWILRKDTETEGFLFKELGADKMPIGKHDKDSTPFTSHTFDLQKGDIVYTLTDGFPDQFGGPKEKKFMYKKLKELLLSIAHLSMPYQIDKLSEAFDEWKGPIEQVDDVLIIGVKI